MNEHPHLHLLDGILDAELTVDTDTRTHSALVTFTVTENGRTEERWTMSIWLDGTGIEGFIVRNLTNRLELVVRDIRDTDNEPALTGLVARVCAAGNFTVPT